MPPGRRKKKASSGSALSDNMSPLWSLRGDSGLVVE